MRLFLLQIHSDRNGGGYEVPFDELYHFEDFNDLCLEFKNKLNYYTRNGFKLKGIEEPTLDEVDDEVGGMFKFIDASGYRIIARVTDVHIGD